MVTQTDLIIGGAVALAVAGVTALALKQGSDIFGNIKESLADITGPIEAVTTAVKGAGQGVLDFGADVKTGASEPTYVTLRTTQTLLGYDSTKTQFESFSTTGFKIFLDDPTPVTTPPTNVIGSPRNTAFGPVSYIGPGPEDFEPPFETFDSIPFGQKVGEVAGRFWNYATNSWEAGGNPISFIPFFGAWLDKKVGNLDA